MATKMYLMKLETNLHVGNGDINYNIVDNEVERDVLTNQPIIYSSGMKGAFREYFTNELKIGDQSIIDIFGSDPKNSKNDQDKKPGGLKFFNGNCILLAMRNSAGTKPYSLVTTKTNLMHLVERMKLFNIPSNYKDKCDFNKISDLNNYSLSNNNGLEVEGKAIQQRIQDSTFKNMLLDLGIDREHDIVIFSNKSMEDYNLPVVARNVLENKISKNLWYEEFVPYNSYFYTFVSGNDDLLELFDLQVKNKIVQFGANQSIGYGLVKMISI
ncbi:type III-B CRISPR module RAMP protein Cmr4 [Thomasclavelia sp.]|uniref:type III-B CRISPR module RAMP protein Cmr4 n=1 Tax=Thomasclavelia sp. TaxID=3025757 RepID=UPI0025FAAD84|nr:type III-B CRISPR module RAMP protein Cmr4 [Thomasclavelia sp.]